MKERKTNKTTIILVIIAVIATLIICRLYDERDYYMHQAYAERNNCTWSWNDAGDWTICK